MRVKELKEKLKDMPDDLDIEIHTGDATVHTIKGIKIWSDLRTLDIYSKSFYERNGEGGKEQ